ncbi:MAG TPA: methyltransferase domain-containing protein [Desulfobacteraceae bacterium]|nr:methyltransferase domain-containing protein [Desulfobacteraceae bacterium]
MIREKIKNVLQTFRKGEFEYYIEEFNCYNNVLFIKGWVFSRKQKIEKIGYINNRGECCYPEYELLDSSDIVDVHGQVAEQARFFTVIDRDLPEDLLNISLVFATAKSSCTVTGIWQDGVDRGPYGAFLPDFFSKLSTSGKRLKVLEIGSRARSGVSNRERYIPSRLDFVGVDIKEGPDVDIVCDAHELSRHVEHDSFDCVYSLNTFEHLLMPWKVALEINRVLKQDGIVMIFTHHTFPLHDIPWDFWRFSDNAWHGIFNSYSGFEIIETGFDDPVSIVAKSMYAGTIGMKDAPAYAHSRVVARKISGTDLTWDAEATRVLRTMYPE